MGEMVGGGCLGLPGVLVLPGEGRDVRLGEAGVVTIKVARPETGGSMTAYEFGMPPQTAGPPEHIHRTWDELFRVLEGEVTFLIGGAISVAPAGSYVFIPHGVPHTFWIAGAAGARQLTVLTPSGIEDYFDEASAAMIDGSPHAVAAAAAVMERHDTVLVPGSRAAYGPISE